ECGFCDRDTAIMPRRGTGDWPIANDFFAECAGRLSALAPLRWRAHGSKVRYSWTRPRHLLSTHRPLTALCGRWPTMRCMAEDAPHLPLAMCVGSGSVGWKPVVHRGASNDEDAQIRT